jgi:PilZ domain
VSKKEFRRSPRRKLRDIVLVSDVMTDEIVGRIGNLSEGGLLLIASTPLTEDALYQFRFRLPGETPLDLEVGAHLLWLDRASTPGQSWVGFRFISLSERQHQQLRDWIDAPGAEYD